MSHDIPWNMHTFLPCFVYCFDIVRVWWIYWCIYLYSQGCFTRAQGKSYTFSVSMKSLRELCVKLTGANCNKTTQHSKPCVYFVCILHGPLIRYVKLRVVHASGMPGTFSPPSRIRDPDMHHGTYVTHVPWCMPGSLTSGFLWSRWRGKRSRHSRRKHNAQFYVSGKRPMRDVQIPTVFSCTSSLLSSSLRIKQMGASPHM